MCCWPGACTEWAGRRRATRGLGKQDLPEGMTWRHGIVLDNGDKNTKLSSSLDDGTEKEHLECIQVKKIHPNINLWTLRVCRQQPQRYPWETPLLHAASASAIEQEHSIPVETVVT
ncbi:putative Helicase With Zinc Finger Domain [Manis pentadactyla]|nr:putative Helicase With Zinc Finger Domain [Manis pentadactyla]